MFDVLDSRPALLFGLVFFAFFGWFLSETLGNPPLFWHGLSLAPVVSMYTEAVMAAHR
jgi:hypothetical protein